MSVYEATGNLQFYVDMLQAEGKGALFMAFERLKAMMDAQGLFAEDRKRALQAIDLDQVRSNGYSFQIEMTHKIWRQGMKVVEVPIIFTDRFLGRSKMSGHIVREALIMVWRLFFQNKLRRSPAGK